ncbi:hypothetical protein EPO34_00680 [Patescibacteria group bacterium]|nr:MAG: hypothetical protein EPO34_00680 [Patescibacteria group bacterium]
MSAKETLTLERLLTRIGSEPVPADPRHFYALRRALLNSPYFERHRTAETVALWVETARIVFAGGMVTVAFVLVVRQAVIRQPVVVMGPEAPVQVAEAVQWQIPDSVSSITSRITLSAAR